MKTMNVIIIAVVVAALSAFATGCATLNENTEGQIVAALEAKHDAFKTCYESALERDRTVQGNVGLLLQIDEEPGAVTSSTVEQSDIQDDQMNQCVAGAASDIVLPEPPGVPVEGHYTVNFGFE